MNISRVDDDEGEADQEALEPQGDNGYEPRPRYHTRSRGQLANLPNVMEKLLEYKIK